MNLRTLTYRSQPRADGMSNARRRGTVLIVTLTIVFVLASMVLVFGRAMRVEATASSNRVAAAQARAIAHGAARAILELGDELPADAVELGGGAFWVLHPNPEDDRTHAFGIVDEAARINVNAAWRDTLLLLTHMTEQAADAIIEWRGGDEDAVAAGAYTMFGEPYVAKQAPFETLEELLLVHGITPLELYGEDANRNGVLDPNENDGGLTAPPDAGDGRLDYGLAPFLTVYSREPEGDRLNVNTAGSNAGGMAGRMRLEEILEETIGSDRAQSVAARIITRLPHRHMIDLFYKSEMTVEEFHRVGPRLVTSGGAVLGRININTAPREVLLALVRPDGEPVLTDSDAEALLAHRAELRASHPGAPGRVTGAAQMPGGTLEPHTAPGAEPHPLATIAWVTEVLDAETAMALGPRITGRSYQYSADIVAVSPGGRAFERYRMVYDTSGEQPRVLHWARLTHLGWPLDPAILAELRAGTPASQLTRTTDWGRF